MIAYVGAISALLAAIIACTQTDIKRVLAYSTISQIGYMMFALGVSGYGGEHGLGYMASMFHFFTHAFFKSLLFLCAGAVIHVVHSNEMKDMGGLRKLMPLTHIAFLIACLSIAGIPPFSGFFSKEEILTAAYNSNKFIYGMGVFTSMLTAFYMFRLYFMIFHNKQPHVESASWRRKFINEISIGCFSNMYSLPQALFLLLLLLHRMVFLLQHMSILFFRYYRLRLLLAAILLQQDCITGKMNCRIKLLHHLERYITLHTISFILMRYISLLQKKLFSILLAGRRHGLIKISWMD